MGKKAPRGRNRFFLGRQVLHGAEQLCKTCSLDKKPFSIMCSITYCGMRAARSWNLHGRMGGHAFCPRLLQTQLKPCRATCILTEEAFHGIGCLRKSVKVASCAHCVQGIGAHSKSR